MAKASTASGKIVGETKTKSNKSDRAKSGGTGKPAKPGLFVRLAQYFRDVRSEMKRVVWPQRPEVINSSMVVVVTLLFFVFFTLITDWVVVKIMGYIAGIGQ